MAVTLTVWGTRWVVENDRLRLEMPGSVPLTAGSVLELRGVAGDAATLWTDLKAAWPNGAVAAVAVRAPVRRVGDEWRVVAGAAVVFARATFGRPHTPDDLLTLGLGGLQTHSSTPSAVAVDGDILFRTADGAGAGTPVLAAPQDEQPLVVTAAALGLRLDLTAAALHVGPESYVGRLGLLYDTEDIGVTALHTTRLGSLPFALDLTADPAAAVVLPLAPTGRVFLNPELRRRDQVFGAAATPNELLPGLEARGARLALELALDATRPQVSKLDLLPLDPTARATFEVVCWAATDESGAPLTLAAESAGVRVRLGNPSAASPLNIPALVLDRLRPVAAALSAEIHGLRPAAWGRLRGGDVDVVGRVVPAETVAARLGVPPELLPTNAGLGTAAACYESLPVLERRGAVDADHARFQIPLRDLTPGTGAVPGVSDIEPLRFTGGVFEWPLLDVEWLRAGNWQVEFPAVPPPPVPPPTPSPEDDPDDGTEAASSGNANPTEAFGHPLRAAVMALNARLADPASGPAAGQAGQTHASRIRIAPATAPQRNFQELVPDAAPAAAAPPRPLLARHDLVQKYGSLVLPLDLPAAADVGEDVFADPTALLPQGDRREAFDGIRLHRIAGDPLGLGTWFRVPFISTANARMPLDLAVDSFPAPGLTSQGVVLVKNRRGRGLKEFVAALPPGRGGTRFLVEELIEKKWIDPDVLAPGWTGLVVLRCGFQVLAGGLGNLFAKFLAEPMQYIAVTAQEPGEAREFPEVYGTFRYESPAASRPPADPAADDRDVEWDLELLDVRFRAREIVSLQLNGTLTIFKLFRADPEAGAQPSTFEITGRYQGKDDADNPTRRARVLLEGAPKNPLRVDVNVGPVKAGRLDRVRVSVEGVDPDAPTGSGGRFEIDGAIELDPAWRLGPIGIGADANGKSEVPIRRLGLSLGTTPRMSWDWPALEFPLAQREPVRLGPLTFRFERFGFSVPDATTHRHTLLDDTLRVAGNGDITAARCPFAVARVELFKYPEFGPKAGQTLGFDLVAALDHDGTAPKIGVKGIDFKNLDIDLFRLVRLRAKSISVDQVPNGTRQYIEVREMKLDFLEKPLIENLTVALLQDGPERGFAAYLEQDIDLGLLTIRWVLVSYHLRLAKSARLLLSLEDVGPETDVRDAIVADVKGAGPLTAGGPGWGFGIGCELLGGGIACKLLYVDGGSSGLMVKSPLLEDAIGFGGLAVGYLKGERPEDDRYWTEFPVPMMDFGPVAFLGGVIGLEYLVRGGFTFDAGFPWLRDGLRRWDRGFGVNYGIFVGHAGFYVKYHPGTAPTDDGTTKTLTLAAGFGIAVGYGYCDTYLGVFTVYLSVEVYAIVEGALVLALPGGTPEPRSASLAGIVGLVARGVGKLDVWVLSAEFEVLVFGETESRVDWQPGRPTHVTYTIRQGYHISASCRIGRGILSWTYHYDANMTFELSGSIAL